MAVSEGFILTRQQLERRGQTYLQLWLTTDSGPVCLTTPAQPLTFFINQQDEQRVRTLLNSHGLTVEYRSLKLKDFTHQPVSGLYFQLNKDLYSAKDILQQQNIVCYEDDIRLADRFLMERFVYGSCQFSGRNTDPKKKHQLIDGQVKSSHYQPQFRVLSLDIECSEHGELYCVGLVADGYQQVIMIGEPQPDSEWIIWVEDEQQLLVTLLERFEQYDADIVLGWNVVNFDFRVLQQRCDVHGIPCRMGRDTSLLRWRQAPGDSHQYFLTMPGRVVVDGIDSLKSATYQFDSFSLEFVAQALLGKGKQTEDVDNRMAQINHDFRHNKLKLAEYNLQDCQLVLDIFAHTRLLDFLTLRSQLTGLELDRIGGSVAAFTNLYLPKLHRAGYIAPNRPEHGGLASPGGYVMTSRPGLYEHVLVLDFKSLYPSIIRTFKIDPLGLIEGLKAPESAIPGYRGASFSRDNHFLPDIITHLWQQRDEAKRQKDSARSQAIKILMNSFYGVLGSGGCRFYDTRLASSITLRGHQIMQTTAEWITEQSHQVIYGDTDSTFVWLQGIESEQQALEIGRQLEQLINQRWQQHIAEQYQLPCELEIEFETHFRHFLMPTIRGAETGSKKRYAGLTGAAQGNKLVFKGLETVRSDWTELAKIFQTRLYQMVFDGQDIEQYVRDIVIQTRQGQHDSKLVYRKRLRQKLSRYVKNVPPHVRAARMADELNQQQGKALRYQNKGWIAYVMTVNGPEPIEYQSSPLDYDHYIERQIKPVAEGILPFIHVDFDSLSSDQLGLF